MAGGQMGMQGQPGQMGQQQQWQHPAMGGQQFQRPNIQPGLNQRIGGAQAGPWQGGQMPQQGMLQGFQHPTMTQGMPQNMMAQGQPLMRTNQMPMPGSVPGGGQMISNPPIVVDSFPGVGSM